MVFSGLVIAWRLATCPTSRSPFLVNPTTDGVVRPPSSFGMTLGSPPSMTATTEFVVPRSIPIIFPMATILLAYKCLKINIKKYNNSYITRCEYDIVNPLDEGRPKAVAETAGLLFGPWLLAFGARNL